MKLPRRFITHALLAAILAAASSAFAAPAARRIYVPARNVPSGVSPELADSLVLEAEQGLERFRLDASSRPPSAPAPNADQFVTLQKQRVRVTVDWRDPSSGRSGRAYALPQEDRFSFFYYDDPNNPEIFVKVLDFTSASPFLIFLRGLDFF